MSIGEGLTVVVVCEGGLPGKNGTSDESLFRTLTSLSGLKKAGASLRCAMAGPVLTQNPDVWDMFGQDAKYLIWENGIFESLKATLKSIRTNSILLINSGDCFFSNASSRLKNALRNHDVRCHTNQCDKFFGFQPTHRFFPGWDLANDFFRQTGIPLFHPSLSGMMFRLDAFHKLLEQSNACMPLQWELGTMLISGQCGLQMDFSLVPLSYQGSSPFFRHLGDPQIDRMKRLGIDPCVYNYAEKFPVLSHVLKDKDARILCSEMVVHSPETLLTVALFMEFGPGRWKPLTDFLTDHPELTHEREYSFASFIAPGPAPFSKEDLLKFLGFGKEFWPHSTILKRNGLIHLLSGGLGKDAIEMYPGIKFETGEILALWIRCLLQAGELNRAENLNRSAWARLKMETSFKDQKALACLLAETGKWEEALPYLKTLNEHAPYDDVVSSTLFLAIIGIYGLEKGRTYVQRLLAKDGLKIEAFIRRLHKMKAHDAVLVLMDVYFSITDMCPLTEKLAEQCSDAQNTRLLVLFLKSVVALKDLAWVETLRSALDVSSGLSDFEKAKALKNVGEFQESLRYFDRVSASDADFVEARYLRAGSLTALNRFVEAEAGFKEVLFHQPHRLNIHLNIMDLYKYQKQWDRARNLGKKLREKYRAFPGLARKEQEIERMASIAS
jgi:tetratricopeptide (TPR) repeat protein